jgi:hypothetical protein
LNLSLLFFFLLSQIRLEPAVYSMEPMGVDASQVSVALEGLVMALDATQTEEFFPLVSSLRFFQPD